VLVSAGGGDNMMGAIGTGNTRPGLVTASFGTSGTIYACADKPVIDPEGEIAAFCDSTNRWLPLLCTMNVTVATEMMRADFGYTHEQFENKAKRSSAGSEGLLLLPYLEGERTPNVPDGTGVMIGINTKTFRASNYCRAAMEGVTLGMNYGLRRLAELGVTAKQIRATGGGAKSKLWRQIMADVFNAEVVTLKVSEGAAYGAALQALWCWRLQQGEKIKIEDITDEFVALNKAETTTPEKLRRGDVSRIAGTRGCRMICPRRCAACLRSIGRSILDAHRRVDPAALIRWNRWASSVWGIGPGR
jgi:xylulokinase